MMDKEQIDAARKLADDGDGLGRVLVGEPVVVDLFKIRVTIANILSEQAATVRGLATALEQAQSERDAAQAVYSRIWDAAIVARDTIDAALSPEK
jgi:hypothetical protein